MITSKINHLLTIAKQKKYDEFQSLTEVFEALKVADDYYYNDQPILTDPEYDALRKYAEIIEPHNIYFTGVGSAVRGSKVKLPYELGSLDQVEIGEIFNWIKKWSLEQETIITSEKLDGISGMLLYHNKKLQIAYSRGNGTEGADITRHVRNFKCVPKVVKSVQVVRGEIIFPKEVFKKLKNKIYRKNKATYKNARNAVAGLMNSKETTQLVYDNIHFVAYDILEFNNLDKHQMFESLKFNGFLTPKIARWSGDSLTDYFLAKYLNNLRENSLYEIDGIVLDVDLNEKRKQMDPTRDTLNPAYTVKYKVADSSNLAVATVTNVEWNVSKHGYLKPRIQIKPVELVGVTVQNATGFNAKFIYEHKIGPGAQIQITRSGDVIPFCQKVIQPAKQPQMPSDEWTWVETGNMVDAVLVGFDNNIEVIQKRIVDFFSAINAPMLKDGNVVKLVNDGYDSVDKIILATEDQLVNVIGENGKKIYAGIRSKLTNIPLYKLIGAFSNQRGIGVRRMKKIQADVGFENLLNNNITYSNIVNIEGFDQITAKQVIDVINNFQSFYDNIKHHVSFEIQTQSSGGPLAGEKVVMTGFRDKILAANIESTGGDIQTAISGKTTILIAKDPNSSSAKMKKARSLGVNIFGIDEFKQKYGF